MKGKEDWIWMGHAGHLCIGNQCQFKLNTYVNGHIVSTVGEYLPDEIILRAFLERKINTPRAGFDVKFARRILKLKGDYFKGAYIHTYGYEELGLMRTYETMVFKGVMSEHGCCPYVTDKENECLYMDGYSDPNTATEGHYKACWMAQKDEFPSE